jgi:hypothetical protein
MGRMAEVHFPAAAKYFLFCTESELALVPTQTSNLTGTGDSFLESKVAGARR